jgi:hypothetical protein
VKEWLAFVKDGSNSSIPKIAPQVRRNAATGHHPDRELRDQPALTPSRLPECNHRRRE